MHTFPDLNSIFSLPVVVVVCLYAHIHVIGFLVLENQDGELGIGDVGSLFGGEGGGCFD